ncbi:hypothetical protein L596_007116 [Steinernema carpocapsae]|uniref:Uncharacterized protein n=1 Tax=Steinernema carpocapsae TaxID=34508 RepID=A0A4U5P8P6_STECR|nr:hypothetical protein L596_007116 [Steinernema carpocapsae]
MSSETSIESCNIRFFCQWPLSSSLLKTFSSTSINIRKVTRKQRSLKTTKQLVPFDFFSRIQSLGSLSSPLKSRRYRHVWTNILSWNHRDNGPHVEDK